jgi:hypothetical protein
VSALFQLVHAEARWRGEFEFYMVAGEAGANAEFGFAEIGSVTPSPPRLRASARTNPSLFFS